MLRDAGSPNTSAKICMNIGLDEPPPETTISSSLSSKLTPVPVTSPTNANCGNAFPVICMAMNTAGTV